jgi:hypothetical protein
MPARLGFPFSFFGHNRNCAQETGGPPVLVAAKMPAMEGRKAILAQRFAHRGYIGALAVVALLVLAVLWAWNGVQIEAAVVATPRLTFVVFADRQMPDGEWRALFGDLRRDVESIALETHLYPNEVEVVRGDTLVPGIEFEETVSIYLHGDCRLLTEPERHVVEGTLGWVLRDGRKIEPFIHVDCKKIGEIVGQHALGMDQNQRNLVMAEAIVRVVLHEWVHVVTQSPSHRAEGIIKGSFSLSDLIPSYAGTAGRVSHGK